MKRGEALERMCDPSFHAAMIYQSPGIGPHLQFDTYSVFKMAMRIREDAADQLNEIQSSEPGEPSVSMDGATVNGKSVIVYSYSKGDTFTFEFVSELGSFKVRKNTHCFA